MSGNRDLSNSLASLAGGVIDYDLLAQAMMRLSGTGGGDKEVRGVSVKGVDGDLSGIAAKPEVKKGEGVDVGSKLMRSRGGVSTVDEQRGGVPDGFGRLPSSDSGVNDDDGDAESYHSLSTEGSVSGGCPGAVCSAVRNIQFGGMKDVHGAAAVEAETKPAGYFALTAKKASTRELAAHILKLSGVKVPKSAMSELGVCTYTAGVMPMGVPDGAAKLKSLAAVGDAAVTQHLTVRAYRLGQTVASAQAYRSSVTSNAHFRVIMQSAGLVEYVSYAPGVDPSVTLATSTAFEAIVGVLVLYRTPMDVAKFLHAVKLFT